MGLNLKNLYKNGNKWCTKCGEPREDNPKNRCPICKAQLRGRKRN